MVSFSLETQISLSKAIERDFDTQSKSCLPFFLPPGSFERLNAKKLHQLLLVSSSTSKQQGSGILLPKGGEDYGSWGKMGNSKSKIFPLFFQRNTSPTWNTLLFPIQKDVCNNTYALQAKFPQSAQRPNFLCSLA